MKTKKIRIKSAVTAGGWGYSESSIKFNHNASKVSKHTRR